jgi:hypothetical protein
MPWANVQYRTEKSRVPTDDVLYTFVRNANRAGNYNDLQTYRPILSLSRRESPRRLKPFAGRHRPIHHDPKSFAHYTEYVSADTFIATTVLNIERIMPGKREADCGYNQCFTKYWYVSDNMGFGPSSI